MRGRRKEEEGGRAVGQSPVSNLCSICTKPAQGPGFRFLLPIQRAEIKKVRHPLSSASDWIGVIVIYLVV